MQPHGLQQARLLCPSLSPRVCANSCPLSMMPSNHLIPFSFCPQPFPVGVFSSVSALCIKWPKYWCFGFNNSPSNEYSGLIPLGLTGLIALLCKGLSRVSSNTTVQKHCGLGKRTINSLMITMQEAKKLGHILSIPLHSTQYTEKGF